MDKTILLKGGGTFEVLPSEIKITGETVKQVLVYHGTLTESELKAENDKVIDLERWQPLEVLAEPEIKIEYVTAE